MPNSQVNVTMNVGQNPSDGKYVYSFSGDNVDSSGNMDFSSFNNAIQATITINSVLDVEFEGPARDTMLMCPADQLPPGGCPTSAYSNGTEFNGFTFASNDPKVLRFIDNNNDNVDWAYALQLHNNTTNTNFVCDPNIINR
ncbi:hypothetical protein [Lysobacter terrae]